MAAIKKTGTFNGKSNKLGYGGRAAQMRAQGVPGGVIGAIARREGGAPGGPNFHGGRPFAKGGRVNTIGLQRGVRVETAADRAEDKRDGVKERKNEAMEADRGYARGGRVETAADRTEDRRNGVKEKKNERAEADRGYAKGGPVRVQVASMQDDADALDPLRGREAAVKGRDASEGSAGDVDVDDVSATNPPILKLMERRTARRAPSRFLAGHESQRAGFPHNAGAESKADVKRGAVPNVPKRPKGRVGGLD